MPNEKKKYRYFTKALTCPDGSRKYIRGKTQKELDEKVRKAMYELDMGININDDTTFGELAQMWVDLVKKPHNKPQSMRVVLNNINGHLMPLLGHLLVRDIRSAHIAATMLAAGDLSHATQSTLLAYLRAIFAFAVDNQLISRSPVPSTMKPAGETTKKREPLTPEECAALLKEADTKNEWLRTFTRLCLFLGLRAGEACGLCWDCVDFTTGTIHVRRQVVYTKGRNDLTDVLKTSASHRSIPAPPELMAYLRRIKSTATSITVLHTRAGKPVAPGMAGDAYSRFKSVSGLHPHRLRHTYATRLVESGMDIKEVQYLLGHSTPNMTLNIYAHYDRRTREAATALKVANVSFTL